MKRLLIAAMLMAAATACHAKTVLYYSAAKASIIMTDQPCKNRKVIALLKKRRAKPNLFHAGVLSNADNPHIELCWAEVKPGVVIADEEGVFGGLPNEVLHHGSIDL